jgi:catechol 2,3-dioxygenase
MATRPLDVDGLLAEPEPAVDDPGMPPGTTLGHVHLQVADLDSAESFWVGAVGFDVVVRGYPGALFVSAGGYHHHLGLNTWAGVGTPPPPAGARGIVDFDLLLPDDAAVARTAGRLEGTDSAERDGSRVRASDPSGNTVVVGTA